MYAYAQSNFQIFGRSVELSKDPATYNMTYEAKGPFSGYRPYLDKKRARCALVRGNGPDALHHVGDR